jgi:hypothetical protein
LRVRQLRALWHQDDQSLKQRANPAARSGDLDPTQFSGFRATARHGDLAGSRHLHETERADHLFERFDLLIRACDFENHSSAAHVYHSGTEDLSNLK